VEHRGFAVTRVGGTSNCRANVVEARDPRGSDLLDRWFSKSAVEVERVGLDEWANQRSRSSNSWPTSATALLTGREG
jgi:hypothetical protein